ncbi:TPA: hypothetical protein ACU6J5_005979 [Pseudomonas aeruginosa]
MERMVVYISIPLSERACFQQEHSFPFQYKSLSGVCGGNTLFDIAQAAGVTCLEQRWLGSTAYHRFKCPVGHQWVRTGKNLLQRPECPDCHIQAKQSGRLRQLKAKVSRQGGECLVDTFVGLNWRYWFRCGQGHEWKAMGLAVLRGCGSCARCAPGSSVFVTAEVKMPPNAEVILTP